jgi:hypothetical protein
VRYASAAAFRTALEARLKAEQSTGVGLSRRLLARLVTVAPDAWVLKGGFALELRLGSRARSTRDVDVDWLLGDDAVGELLRQAAALELDDCFEFTIERSAAADDLAGGGQRGAVGAALAGPPFERVAIDVGLGVPVLEPELVVSSQSSRSQICSRRRCGRWPSSSTSPRSCTPTPARMRRVGPARA